MNEVTTPIYPRIILEAKIIRACEKCSHKMVDEIGQPLNICPNCGHIGVNIEDLGVISDSWWHRKRRNLINRLKDAYRSFNEW